MTGPARLYAHDELSGALHGLSVLVAVSSAFLGYTVPASVWFPVVGGVAIGLAVASILARSFGSGGCRPRGGFVRRVYFISYTAPTTHGAGAGHMIITVNGKLATHLHGMSEFAAENLDGCLVEHAQIQFVKLIGFNVCGVEWTFA